MKFKDLRSSKFLTIVITLLLIFLSMINGYTVMTTSKECKTSCIERSKNFCPSSDMKIGYCCELNEQCPNSFGNCSSNFTIVAMQYFMCPQDTFCGSSYIVQTSNIKQSMGVNTNQFSDQSICHYVFTPPTGASEGDALYIKMESISLATAIINQSKDFKNFGTQYQLNVGQYVTIYLPNVILLTVRANSTLAGYFYLSYQYFSKANLNQINQTNYAGSVQTEAEVINASDWMIIFIIIACALIFIMLIVVVVLLITYRKVKNEKVSQKDIDEEFQRQLAILEKEEESQKALIIESKDTNLKENIGLLKDQKGSTTNVNEQLTEENGEETDVKQNAVRMKKVMRSNSFQKPDHNDYDEVQQEQKNGDSKNKFFNLPPQAMAQTAYAKGRHAQNQDDSLINPVQAQRQSLKEQQPSNKRRKQGQNNQESYQDQNDQEPIVQKKQQTKFENIKMEYQQKDVEEEEEDNNELGVDHQQNQMFRTQNQFHIQANQQMDKFQGGSHSMVQKRKKKKKKATALQRNFNDDEQEYQQ